MSPSDSPLAQVLLRLKQERQFTIKELAKAVRINHMVVFRMLHGAPISSLLSAKRLAQAFNWTPAELGAMTMYYPPSKKRKSRDAA
jgi:hypothetical protein